MKWLTGTGNLQGQAGLVENIISSAWKMEKSELTVDPSSADGVSTAGELVASVLRS